MQRSDQELSGIKDVQKHSRAIGVSVSPCHIDRDKLHVVLAAVMKLPEDFDLKFIQPKFWRSVGSESGCTGVVAGQ